MLVDLDEMGTLSAKRYPGVRRVPIREAGPHGPHEGRAKLESDSGRRGTGYVFGAPQAAPGEAFTAPYAGRTIANFVDFLERGDAWRPPAAERVYAILDNLDAHRATDVLLVNLAHPRWQLVFQPKYAACLDRIEPW